MEKLTAAEKRRKESQQAQKRHDRLYNKPITVKFRKTDPDNKAFIALTSEAKRRDVTPTELVREIVINHMIENGLI